MREDDGGMLKPLPVEPPPGGRQRNFDPIRLMASAVAISVPERIGERGGDAKAAAYTGLIALPRGWNTDKTDANGPYERRFADRRGQAAPGASPGSGMRDPAVANLLAEVVVLAAGRAGTP